MQCVKNCKARGYLGTEFGEPVIIISTSSTLTLVPFMVASRFIVALASRPTIAATSIPPFNLNNPARLCRTRFSAENWIKICASADFFFDRLRIKSFNCLAVVIKFFPQNDSFCYWHGSFFNFKSKSIHWILWSPIQ